MYILDKNTRNTFCLLQLANPQYTLYTPPARIIILYTRLRFIQRRRRHCRVRHSRARGAQIVSFLIYYYFFL